MKNILKKLLKNESGFTLVEVLIAVGILGLIAAIAIPTIGNVRSSSEVKAQSAETATVQAAVDAMMADQEVESLPSGVGSATQDMTVFPDATLALNGDSFGDFLRQTTTKYCYTATTDGYVSLVLGTC